MPSICFCFQVHQPFRLRKYSFFDIDRVHHYFDDDEDCRLLGRIVEKCYQPANEIMLKLIDEYRGDFKIAFSMTGLVLERLEQRHPEALDGFKRLADTGCVELLGETYYHSLAFLASQREFKEQVGLHRDKIRAIFGQMPQTFRNTELIYNNDLARRIESSGYRAVIAEGADRVLGPRSPNYVYRPAGCRKLKCLLKNYRLSDDVAFRFSDRDWPGYPLTAEKYAGWLHGLNGEDVIVLYMDYETFGEHQWADTGIFEFLKALPGAVLRQGGIDFKTPREAVEAYQPAEVLDVPHFISWADTDRDLSAWLGNHLQNDAFRSLYAMEKRVRGMKDPERLDTWRKLQCSDHFHYMCTKQSADGEVHKYFNPYESPYDAYINYMNILDDFCRTARAAH